MQRHGMAGIGQKVLAVEGDEFRDARPGVIEQLEQKPVTFATKGIWGRGFQHGSDFRGCQIAQEWAGLPFGGDGQNLAGQG